MQTQNTNAFLHKQEKLLVFFFLKGIGQQSKKLGTLPSFKVIKHLHQIQFHRIRTFVFKCIY